VLLLGSFSLAGGRLSEALSSSCQCCELDISGLYCQAMVIAARLPEVVSLGCPSCGAPMTRFSRIHATGGHDRWAPAMSWAERDGSLVALMAGSYPLSEQKPLLELSCQRRACVMEARVLVYSTEELIAIATSKARSGGRTVRLPMPA
jgi:hypothetical protein